VRVLGAVAVRGRAPGPPAALRRLGHPPLGALPDHLRLELGDARHDRQHQPAHGRVGKEVLGDAPHIDAPGAQAAHIRQGVLGLPGQAGELPRDDGVELLGARRPDHLLEARPIIVPARERLVPVDPVDGEARALAVRPALALLTRDGQLAIGLALGGNPQIERCARHGYHL